MSSAGLSSLLKLCTPQLSQPAVSHQSFLNTGPAPGTHPAPRLPILWCLLNLDPEGQELSPLGQAWIEPFPSLLMPLLGSVSSYQVLGEG